MSFRLPNWPGLVLLGLLLPPATALGAGTPGATSAETQALRGDQAAAVAADHYQQAMSAKTQAWRQQALADNSAHAAERAAARSAAQQAYQAMIESLELALKASPRYVEAATELGYALRQTGNYRKAIGAYNYALGIDPAHFEAVEYRGQAYLAQNDLRQARQDYMTLFRGSPELAAALLAAMEVWITRQSPGVDEDFSRWVDERKTLADPALNPSEQW